MTKKRKKINSGLMFLIAALIFVQGVSAATPAQDYATYCSTCHGANQQGGIGPNITPAGLGSLGITTAAQLNTILTTGAMASQASAMSASNISALSLWLLNPSGTPTPSPPANSTPAPAPAQNYAIYCSACHGANQQGGIGPDITPGGLASEGITTAAQLDAILTTGEMRSQASAMSASDISALSQWLLNPSGMPITAPAPTHQQPRQHRHNDNEGSNRQREGTD